MKLKSYYGTDPKGQGFFWPDSEQKRRELFAVKRSAPAEFESVYQCNPGAREGAIFLESDFCYFDPPNGLAEGISSPSVQDFLSHGQIIMQSWDTAFSAESDNDYSVCVTAALRPCTEYHCGEDVDELGECDAHYDVDILDVFRERLDWGNLTSKAKEQHRKWNPSIVVVEKKASGVPLIGAMSKLGMYFEGIDANVSKRARAINGVGAGSVQGWFRLHRVGFPAEAPWLEDFKKELKDFVGDGAGYDDQVDAIVHLVTYAIRLGGSAALIPTDWTPESVDQQMGANQAANPFESMHFSREVIDPFSGTCSRCVNFSKGFCEKHKIKKAAIDTCIWFDDQKTTMIIQ